MADEQARIPAGVTVAAVVLGLMTFVGLLLSCTTAIAMFVVRSRLISSDPTVRMAAAGVDALVLALVILAICTIVGLFRLKTWARYSILLLGVLDFLAFGFSAIGTLIARVKLGMAAMPLPNNPHMTLGDVMLGVAVFYGILALIGVWWMVYFNLRAVRLAFAGTRKV